MSSNLRYLTSIWTIADVLIPNRYQPKAKSWNSFFKMQIFICRNARYYGHECTEKCASGILDMEQI